MEDFEPTRKLFGLSLKWWLFGAASTVVLIVLLFFLSWFLKPAEMFSPNNLENLSRQANDSWQALEAKQASISVLEENTNDMLFIYGEDTSVWPQNKPAEYLQLKGQITNLTTSYNAECGKYNAFWLDEWRSVPAPNDIPTHCELID